MFDCCALSCVGFSEQSLSKFVSTACHTLLMSWSHASPSIYFDRQRARFRSIESLQSGDRTVVVATDVAARGLDIPSVATVVHYDVARKVDAFVHRAGRTAVSFHDFFDPFGLFRR